jgi:DNA-binding SARP family transcriptional activator
MAAMQYRLLGGLEVTYDGRPVEIGSPKQRAVLALLVLAGGRVVSTDQLIDTVWGAQPPAAATTSLHTYSSNLR